MVLGDTTNTQGGGLAAYRAAQKAAKAAQIARGQQLGRRRAIPSAEVAAPSDAQARACAELDGQLRRRDRSRERLQPERLDPCAGLVRGSRTFSLVRAQPPQEERSQPAATGCRIQDMDCLHEDVAPHVTCPQCDTTGTVSVSRDHEMRQGLGGKLRWFCSSCGEVAFESRLCRNLPKVSKSGYGVAENNFRLTLAAAQTGGGEVEMQQICGAMNLPTLRGKAWCTSSRRLTDSVLPAAEASRKEARAEERLLAYEAGTMPDARGRVDMAGGYDACWAMRASGRAYRSKEGSGTVMGARSGKVLASKVLSKDCVYCKLGTCRPERCHKNYEGSSGGMEPVMGAELIIGLNNVEEGIRLGTYCTDLDAKTRAAVRTAAEARGVEEPVNKFDPGHWKKVFRGNDKGPDTTVSLTGIKKRLPVTNVLGVDDQHLWAKRLKQCVEQHRRCSDLDFFKAAVWNVFDHCFGRHSNCHRFFGANGKAPCQCPNHKPPFKLGLWYNARRRVRGRVQGALQQDDHRRDDRGCHVRGGPEHAALRGRQQRARAGPPQAQARRGLAHLGAAARAGRPSRQPGPAGLDGVDTAAGGRVQHRRPRLAGTASPGP